MASKCRAQTAASADAAFSSGDQSAAASLQLLAEALGITADDPLIPQPRADDEPEPVRNTACVAIELEWLKEGGRDGIRDRGARRKA